MKVSFPVGLMSLGLLRIEGGSIRANGGGGIHCEMMLMMSKM